MKLVDTDGRRPLKVIPVPVYWAAVAMVGVALALVASVVISVTIAKQNSREVLAQYQADQRAAQAADRRFYCAVFGRQADVFSEAQTPTGRAAYQAWLDLYRFAACEPAR